MDSQTALRELQSYQASSKPAQDIYREQQQQLGVDASQQRSNELRKLISGTEQSLRGVEASVTGRTQGSMVTESQRSRLANLERQPLSEQFQTQQGALSDEQALYRDLLQEASNRTGFTYQSQADRLAQLEGNYSKATAAEQAAEDRRRFEANLALEREKASASAKASQKNTYDLQSIINQLLGVGGGSTSTVNRNPNSPELAPKIDAELRQRLLNSIVLDPSRGLNLNQFNSGQGLRRY